MHAAIRYAALVVVTALLACDRATGPDPAAALLAMTPVNQQGVVGALVPVDPAVRVVSSAGRPIADVIVTFDVQGDTALRTVRTGTDGVASAGPWHLDTIATEYTTTAAVSGVPEPLTFRATAAAGPAARLAFSTAPALVAPAGIALSTQPRVRVTDRFGNTVRGPGVPVTASAAGAEVRNGLAVTDSAGVAAFAGLTVDGDAGSYILHFAAPGLDSLEAPAELVARGTCANPATLGLQVGEIHTRTLDLADALTCFDWNAGPNGGQQFLVMLENMPLSGAYDAALFPGSSPSSPLSFVVHATPASAAATALPHVVLRNAAPRQAAGASHSWDFGDGALHEGEPVYTPDARGTPRVSRDGALLSLSAADPVVGDTLVMRMEGIPRLGIPTRNNERAVIRHMSEHLIIAEDVRLGTTLVREGGTFNTPIPQQELAAIAAQYAAVARVQGDLLFDGRHNDAVEQARAGRVVAVHSLTSASNVWGYTYPTGDYFVWDYWAGTNGSTPGSNQKAQRVADNLFMHEIAHLRHVGVLQHGATATPPRGNRWLVEGFARFTERLPIAARLLGAADVSRTSNFTLPRDPLFNNAYFRDDVPTFLSGASSVFGGYQSSSWVFDYLADHVAAAGGDWRLALREVLLAGGAQHTLDETVGRWMPGVNAAGLTTRARIALYLDDAAAADSTLGSTALPAWTQYLQFDIRRSRPAGADADLDPRNAWPRIVPGTAADITGTLEPGAAWGMLIDGRSGTTTRYQFHLPATADAILSITRIR